LPTRKAPERTCFGTAPSWPPLQHGQRRLSLFNLMVEPSRAPVAKALLTPLGGAFACQELCQERAEKQRAGQSDPGCLRPLGIGSGFCRLQGARDQHEECPDILTTSAVVTGAGRLQFYSAPHANCAMAGVFVIPKDELITYAQSNDGWLSVMYSNSKTGNDVSGWVRSSRLKQTGTVGH
jgi:hypothetical protein